MLRIRKKKIRMNGMKTAGRLNVSRMAEKDVRKQLSQRLDEVNLDASWESFKECRYSVGAEVLGHVERKHQDWFNENDNAVKELLAEKHHPLLAYLNCNPKGSQKHESILQQELRSMKRWQMFKRKSKLLQKSSFLDAYCLWS